MQYFDFHTHIILKQLFDESPNIDARINSSDVAAIPRDCTDLPEIIQSQIHQSQLAELSDEVIIGATLYGCESYLAAAVQPLQGFLRLTSKHKMSLDKLKAIAADGFPTFTNFTKRATLDAFVQAPQSFNILTKASFANPLPKNKVNVFFLIEGCHSLVDTINKIDATHRYDPNEILANLEVVLKIAQVIGINITHLQQSSLCNHAFAMQIADPTHFIPLESGFTDDGRKVVQGLFDRNICVDLKHMSYKSRLDFRNEVDAGKYSNVQPPLCSHVGFTGISFKDWAGYILGKPQTVSNALYVELVKPLQRDNTFFDPGIPAFNLSTINLFDEEIVWVVKQGGMIGLSLDRRITGFENKFDDKPTGRDPGNLLYVDKEFISQSEWTALGLNGNQLGNLIDEDNCVTEDTEDVFESDSARNDYFSDHILLHLKHFFQVCFDAGIPIANAQKCITIGSDYDGFINPFMNTDTVEAVPALKEYIKINLGNYLNSSERTKQWASQLNIQSFIDDLFYNNGFNFIKSRFA